MNEEIADLEQQLADLKKRLPAHSIPPGMMAELDDLEERLERAKEEARQEQKND